ncbi:MAG: sugar phosphate nucleotidyltransferase [Candidatus Nanoarchaeia archaeon]|jgi:NDP-sugar pyrophosphorylase family protein
MKAVILAGGMGTRLKDIVNDRPKPMAEFNGKPLIEYLVIQLKEHFDEIIILTGYKSDVIKNYFGDGSKWGANIKYSDETEPLGTGGAIKNAEELIDDDFILINGDNYHELDYEKLKKNFNKTGMNTMVITKTVNPTQVTIIKINEAGLIAGLKERPEKPTEDDKFMNAGILLLKRSVLDLLPASNSSFEKEVFPLLIKQGMRTEVYEGYYIDIGTPSNYFKFKDHLK